MKLCLRGKENIIMTIMIKEPKPQGDDRRLRDFGRLELNHEIMPFYK